MKFRTGDTYAPCASRTAREGPRLLCNDAAHPVGWPPRIGNESTVGTREGLCARCVAHAATQPKRASSPSDAMPRGPSEPVRHPLGRPPDGVRHGEASWVTLHNDVGNRHQLCCRPDSA